MSLDRTRKEILLAAQRLFQENGLDNITMEDIAKSIGKGKSSLYYYFKSKEEIFAAVLDMEVNEIILETIKRISKVQGFRNKIEVFGLVKFEMVKKRKSLYTAMEMKMNADELERYNQLKQVVHINYLEKERTILQQIWMEAISNNTIGKMDNKEIENTILLFLCSLRGINRETLFNSSQESAKNLIYTLCNLFSKES